MPYRQIAPLFLLFFSLGCHAAIYKTTDAAGNVSYSDKPKPNASNVELPPINTTPAYQAPAPEPTRPPQPNQPAYTLQITSPASGTQMLADQSDLEVSIELTPELRPGDLLQVLLDGEYWGSSSTDTPLQVNDIPRGEHQLSVAVINENGSVITTSTPITIINFHPSVNLPNHPNNPANATGKN